MDMNNAHWVYIRNFKRTIKNNSKPSLQNKYFCSKFKGVFPKLLAQKSYSIIFIIQFIILMCPCFFFQFKGKKNPRIDF